MTVMTEPKLTGKRRSMDVKEMDYPVKTLPLVPDLSPAQKALIHEELTKSLLLAETQSLAKSQSAHQPRSQAQKSSARQTESKGHKFGRKLKRLFINDQTKTPSRSQSLDVMSGNNDRTYLQNDDEIDEDDLYRFEGRSKHQWGSAGI